MGAAGGFSGQNAENVGRSTPMAPPRAVGNAPQSTYRHCNFGESLARGGEIKQGALDYRALLSFK